MLKHLQLNDKSTTSKLIGKTNGMELRWDIGRLVDEHMRDRWMGGKRCFVELNVFILGKTYRPGIYLSACLIRMSPGFILSLLKSNNQNNNNKEQYTEFNLYMRK